MQSRLNKNRKGYGYEYTDLAQINKLIEENGQSYYQFIDSVDGNDYIWTVKVDEEGKESKPIRGCKVLESGALSGSKVNPVQQYGSALTYARRYSLLMAYGLATTDDDAESLTVKQEDHSMAKGKARIADRIEEMMQDDDLTTEEMCGSAELAVLEAMTKKTFKVEDVSQVFKAWPKITKGQYVQAMEEIKKRTGNGNSGKAN